ncbi:RNF6 ligase, partial [Locustella ochotensis]|nr:RNF6 ligase [Locustella ochotensis]
MDRSRHRAGNGNEQAPSRERSHGEGERQRQLERLSREEAYYQFINELNEEDYRLMRDRNLLGTPGEITAEELQQRLEGAKERLTSQSDLDNREGEDSEVLGENSNGDSLLEWLNTFRRTGNATRSGQSGNQTWRAVSRTNPNSGEFRFSLEININHDHNGFETSAEEYVDIDAARLYVERRRQLVASSAAPRTRSMAAREANNEAARTRLLRRAMALRSEIVSHAVSGRLRSRTRELTGQTNNTTRSNSAAAGEPREMPERSTSARGRRGRARTNVRMNTNQRLEILRLRSTLSSRSRSPLQRQGDAAPSEERDLRQDRHAQQVNRSRSQTAQASPEPTEEQARGSTQAPQVSSVVLGITSEEEEPSRPVAAVRRYPTITLDLQVRRIRPGENRDRDSIASRTRSRVGMSENTVTFESDSGGFRRTISRSERAGIRTYISTIRIPLRRISETGLGEPSSMALRSILRQIMTGFGELSSLMETESNSQVQRGAHHLADAQDNSSSANSSDPSGVLSQNGQAVDGSSERNGHRGGSQRSGRNHENQDSRQSQDANNIVENGTLPILRLAHFFLLNEDDDDDDRLRGLTKEQIDNLTTRNYGDVHTENEWSKTCSVCINEYATGNKLRQLPCTHEFHIHCIDRWLSENSTCPICRQPVLGSNATGNG